MSFPWTSDADEGEDLRGAAEESWTSVTTASSLLVNVSSTSGNGTNSTAEEYVPYNARLETYIIPFIFAIIFLVGAIGNGSLIHIFLRSRSMRNVPNTFIICLTLGDFLVIVGVVPFISVIYFVDTWPFGLFICRLSEFLKDFSMSVSVITLTYLSVDRYLAISLPISKMRDKRSSKFTYVGVVCIWTIATAIALPGAYHSFLLSVQITPKKSILICYPYPDELMPWYPKLVIGLKFAFLYLVPLVAIGTFYVLMARRLWASSEAPIGNQSTSQVRQLEMRKKLAKMVLALVVMFTVCFLPSYIFFIWFYYTYPDSLQNYNSAWHVTKMTGYVLTFVNSASNPVILYFISGKFRQQFRRHVLCCWPRGFSARGGYSASGWTHTRTLRTDMNGSHTHTATGLMGDGAVRIVRNRDSRSDSGGGGSTNGNEWNSMKEFSTNNANHNSQQHDGQHHSRCVTRHTHKTNSLDAKTRRTATAATTQLIPVEPDNVNDKA